jgi:hypothetical protein
VRIAHKNKRAKRAFFLGTEFVSDGSEIRHLEQHYPKSLSPSLSHPLKEGKEETHQN